jgi:hypothetical protein
VTASYDSAHADATCTATLADISGGSGGAVPAGVLAGHDTTSVSVPVTMQDAGTSTNQQPCVGVAIPLVFTIS